MTHEFDECGNCLTCGSILRVDKVRVSPKITSVCQDNLLFIKNGDFATPTRYVSRMVHSTCAMLGLKAVGSHATTFIEDKSARCSDPAEARGPRMRILLLGSLQIIKHPI